MIGLVFGFAAFSNSLVISSSVTVSPNVDNFSIEFSASDSTIESEDIVGSSINGATAEVAKINGTSISIQVGDVVTNGSLANVVGHSLPYVDGKNVESVVVTVTYDEKYEPVDKAFNVSFGTISLGYSSAA